MRILVLSNLYPPDFVGGYELGCGQVVDSLRQRGHEVQVLTSLPRRPLPPTAEVQRVFQLTDVFRDYYLERSVRPVRHLVQAEANFINAHNVHLLLQHLTDFQPDVVYVWNIWGLGGLGLMLCLDHLQIPWVWHLMDSLPATLCSNWNGVEPGLAGLFGAQLRGHYLACSQRLLKEIEHAGVELQGEVEILPNWVCGHSTPARQRCFRRREGSSQPPHGTADTGPPAGQNLHPPPLRLVYAGQINKAKGIDLLIQMARLLCDSGHQDFSLDLYGRATDPAFAGLIRQLGVGHVVALRGTRTQAELAGLYEAYDLFVFPTWEREPFAFAPLEAAARGCVPLQSRCCGNSEWFVHRVHCLKAERTAAAFAAVVAEVLDGRIDLEPLSRRASAVVGRDFHLDTILPRIEHMLIRASRKPRLRPGTPAEAFRLAVLAEKLTHVLVQECLSA